MVALGLAADAQRALAARGAENEAGPEHGGKHQHAAGLFHQLPGAPDLPKKLGQGAVDAGVDVAAPQIGVARTRTGGGAADGKHQQPDAV